MQIRGLVRPIGAALVFGLITFFAFVVVEGLSSLAILGYQVVSSSGQGLQSRRHVQYDTLLGWVNTPDLTLPDMYGKGVGFQSNHQSLRNRTVMGSTVSAGRLRVLCVGDSFTLGIGVSNEETWCNQLERIDDRLETFNFGEAGYGIGQAYLKYQRHSAGIEYDAIVFAFIENDFVRMQSERFALVYPKPKMQFVDDRLDVGNVPVQRLRGPQRWLARNTAALHALRSVYLGGRLVSRVMGSPDPAVRHISDTHALAMAIFEAAAAEAATNDATTLFVFLPHGAQGTSRSQEMWRRYLGEEFPARGLNWLDVLGPMHQLPFAQQDAMYHPEWRHYTQEGNRLVAAQIYGGLRRILALAQDGEDDGATHAGR